MNSRSTSGFELPPLSFPPPANSSSGNFYNYSYDNSRLNTGVGFLPPPPRARTPSTVSSHPPSSFFNTSLPPSSAYLTTSFPLDRAGAFSVPPQLSSSSSVNANTLTPAGHIVRMTVCGPCRKSHLKCGKGSRPCAQCIKRGKIEECLQGVAPDQAKIFLRAYQDKVAREKDMPPPVRSQTPGPIIDDATLFPLSSSLGASSSSSSGSASSPSSSLFPQATDTLAYPSLGQIDDMPPQLPVILVMGKDLCIGRASRDALRTFGYHPHEMVNQKLANYLPITERAKWKTFSGRMFTPATPAGGALPASPVELARLPLEELAKPVGGMRSISSQFFWRPHSREMMLVRIELWYGCFFGATSTDFSTFDKAIIIARITPLHNNTLPPPGRLPPSSFQDQANFPSVLKPYPPPSPSLDQFTLPRRARTPSLSSSSTSNVPSTFSTLPNLASGLPPLPSLDYTHGLPPLPTLNGLGMTPRKRRSSTALPSLTDTFDHGSDMAPLTARPRLRSPSPLPSHRRSVSSETGQSMYSSSDDSVATPEHDSTSFQQYQRPPSRNHKSSQSGLHLNQLHSRAVQHIPLLLPGFPVRGYPPPTGNEISPAYKTRKYSYIAIDDSHDGPPPVPMWPSRPSTPQGNSRNHYSLTSAKSSCHHPSSSHTYASGLPLPDSFGLLSLDYSPPSDRGSPSAYTRHY